MKGYVYMINYTDKDDEYRLFGDQIECCDKADLLLQLKLLDDNCIVTDIKLVNDKDRYLEKDISKSLYNECRNIIRRKQK